MKAPGKADVQRFERKPFKNVGMIDSSSLTPSLVISGIWLLLAAGVAVWILFQLSEAADMYATLWVCFSLWLGGKLVWANSNLLDWKRWSADRNGFALGYAIGILFLLLFPAVDAVHEKTSGQPLVDADSRKTIVVVAAAAFPLVLGLLNTFLKESKNKQFVKQLLLSQESAKNSAEQKGSADSQ